MLVYCIEKMQPDEECHLRAQASPFLFDCLSLFYFLHILPLKTSFNSNKVFDQPKKPSVFILQGSL